MAELDEATLTTFVHDGIRRTAEAMHQALSDFEFPLAVEYCPKDTTELSQTGYLTDVVYDGLGALMEIGFGTAEAGDTAIYAIVQHENMSLNHPNGGRAKYLESAVLEGQPTLLARTAAAKVAP